MDVIDQAQRAYAGPTLRTARQAEHGVLSAVTARLRRADPENFPSVAGALHDNRRLWTRLAADVAGAGNGLPQALRAQIFYLAEFTAHHSRRVLRGEAGMQPLIDVNTAIMRGLAPVAAAAAPAGAAS